MMLFYACTIFFTVMCESLALDKEYTPNVGTVLFSAHDMQKKQWGKSEIGLLKARRYFQNLLPPPVFISGFNEDQVSILLGYFRDAYASIKKEAKDPETDTILTTALSDAVGGYFKEWILPIAKLDYYGGTISQANVIKLFQFYNEIKRYLDTDGDGWRKPNEKVLNAMTINVAPVQLLSNTRSMKDPCDHLAYFEKTPTGLSIPIPNVNWNNKSSTMFVPLKNASLITMNTPDLSHNLLKYYDAARSCIQSSNPRDQQNFDEKFQTWLVDDVVPHLKDDNLYLALGSVLTLVNRTQSLCNNVMDVYLDKYNVKHKKFNPIPKPEVTEISCKKLWIIIIILLIEIAWCIPALIYILCSKKFQKKDCSSNIYLFIDNDKNKGGTAQAPAKTAVDDVVDDTCCMSCIEDVSAVDNNALKMYRKSQFSNTEFTGQYPSCTTNTIGTACLSCSKCLTKNQSPNIIDMKCYATTEPKTSDRYVSKKSLLKKSSVMTAQQHNCSTQMMPSSHETFGSKPSGASYLTMRSKQCSPPPLESHQRSRKRQNEYTIEMRNHEDRKKPDDHRKPNERKQTEDHRKSETRRHAEEYKKVEVRSQAAENRILLEHRQVEESRKHKGRGHAEESKKLKERRLPETCRKLEEHDQGERYWDPENGKEAEDGWLNEEHMHEDECTTHDERRQIEEYWKFEEQRQAEEGRKLKERRQSAEKTKKNDKVEPRKQAEELEIPVEYCDPEECRKFEEYRKLEECRLAKECKKHENRRQSEGNMKKTDSLEERTQAEECRKLEERKQAEECRNLEYKKHKECKQTEEHRKLGERRQGEKSKPADCCDSQVCKKLEERRLAEDKRKLEECRKLKEYNQAEEKKKLKECNHAEEKKKLEECRKLKECKQAEEQRKLEECRKLKECKQAEEQRKLEECKLEEECKKLEQRRQAEEKRQLEERKLVEECRKLKERKQAEEQRKLEECKLEEKCKQLEERKQAEEKRKLEERKLVEECRKFKERKQAEERKLAEAKKLEECRQAEENRKLEECKQAEEKRKLEEVKKNEECRKHRQFDESRNTDDCRKLKEFRKLDAQKQLDELKKLDELRKLEECRKQKERGKHAECRKRKKVELSRNLEELKEIEESKVDECKNMDDNLDINDSREFEECREFDESTRPDGFIKCDGSCLDAIDSSLAHDMRYENVEEDDENDDYDDTICCDKMIPDTKEPKSNSRNADGKKADSEDYPPQMCPCIECIETRSEDVDNGNVSQYDESSECHLGHTKLRDLGKQAESKATRFQLCTELKTKGGSKFSFGKQPYLEITIDRPGTEICVDMSQCRTHSPQPRPSKIPKPSSCNIQPTASFSSGKQPSCASPIDKYKSLIPQLKKKTADDMDLAPCRCLEQNKLNVSF